MRKSAILAALSASLLGLAAGPALAQNAVAQDIVLPPLPDASQTIANQPPTIGDEAPAGAPAEPATPAPVPAASEPAPATPTPAPAPATPSPAPAAGPASHVIATGDTYWDLAVKYYGDGTRWRAIADANPGLHARRLPVGATLKLPRA